VAIGLLIVWAVGMMYLARFVCGNWLNHLALYTFIWTLTLGAYELHWIRYNPISAEAWLYIFLAWIAIYLGTAMLMGQRKQPPCPPSEEALRRLKTVIILFSLAGVASCVVLAIEIMKEIDPNLFVALSVGAGRIYAAEFEETGQFVGIPYLAFLPFAASALAGVYGAWRGRIDWVSFFPLSVACITGVLSVSRYSMMLSAALFGFSFLLTPKTKPIYLSRIQKILLVVACAGGIVFVSVVRTDLGLSLTEQSTTLNGMSEWISFAPSLYFYISGPPVGLSEYLNDSSREANLPWGRYTFASAYRFLSKLGLATPVPFHQEFYGTPEAINTCTYLREVHSDFGAVGVFLFPFFLGATAGWLSNSRTTLFRILLLTHVYVIVVFSFAYLAMITGWWIQRLAVSLVVSMFLERASRPAVVRSIARTLPGIAS